MNIKYIGIKFEECVKGLVTLFFFRNRILINHCVEENAGDSFNKYFLEKKYLKKTSKYTFGSLAHYIFCGSIITRSNVHSIVLGAGFISEEASLRKVNYKKVIGVRGKKTLEALRKFDHDLNVNFLGDPGLLSREIISPRTEENHEGLIGIIPHFVDYDFVLKNIACEKFHVIDIKKDYVTVCEEILKCKSILSSSLHGLIFSDAMNVPNVWVKFSEKVKGGTFKFEDYYSVMSNPKEMPIICESISDIEHAETYSSVSVNHDYDKMLNAINGCFND
ncbi:polysaccharide pyruvyl transferase family protein [Acinetobacter cumulans]|uniref:Polysaccharide pyruvyl transferase family protein n=1 Tax=Acinetobacter cumulans TaxID=2136182 RepID=A0A3A8G5S9_9GAMM|nr:polysaccharide pyruvyl transferase family protein [Acinetobacter cumulans]RKG48343.1 polysaccharide pyruvyl transferase family protein [Acinetobacter cumulans]